MGLTVRTNMPGLNSSNSLSKANKNQQKSMKKLASGFKINSASDDASGLSISEKMRNQITALDTATENCEDGLNMLQTAEGYIGETQDMINRMVELAEKAANGVLSDEDRDALQDEMDELCAEIDRIATTANFNGRKLLNGSLGSTNQLKLISNPDTKNITYQMSNGYNISSSHNMSIFINEDDIAHLNGSLRYAVVTPFPENKEIEIYKMGSPSLTTVTNFWLEYKNGATATIDNNSNKAIIEMFDNNRNDKFEVGIISTPNTSGSTKTITYKSGYWYDENNNRVDIKLTGISHSGLIMGSFERNVPMNNNGTIDDTRKPSERGMELQIGETSTKPDKLLTKINSFHTDSLFKGLDGFINTTNDKDNNMATASVKIFDDNPYSTYKDAVSVCIDNQENASAAADALRCVSSYISDQRGVIGAQQNRIEHTINDLTTASENTVAAKSRIKDTDMAREMTALTSKNVITQAAQSMLAQANAQPQNVLSLLQQ